MLLAVWRYCRQEKDEEEEGQLEETERSYRLLGVILADETKVMPKDETTDYFESTSRSTNAPPTSPSSSALDLLLEKQQADADASTKMEQHSLGMFGLASGVWLGDTFVREAIPTSLSRARALRDNQRRNKMGLDGKKGTTETNTPKKGCHDSTIEEDRFATWNVGVQKVALRFDWDYREGISQSYTYSKVMGACTSLSSMAKSRATSRGPELIETCRNEEAGGDEGRLGYGRGCLHRRARRIELLPYTAIHDILAIEELQCGCLPDGVFGVLST